MDALSGLDPIPQTSRIRRDNDSQRHFIPRLERTAKDLLRFAALPDDSRLQDLLDGRLGPLRRAMLGSPFWREALASEGLSPRDLRSLSDLAHFPSLDRATCAARWADLPALPAQLEATRDLVVVSSSGSTGQPVRIVKDRFDQIHMWAVLRFWVAWTGVVLPPRPRIALLCGLPTAMAYSARMPAFLEGALHRISLKRPNPLERLRRAHASVLFSDPDGLHWLASQPDPPRPALILTSASHFSAVQREMVTAALGAPIINYYGTTETGPIAWECLAARGESPVAPQARDFSSDQGTGPKEYREYFEVQQRRAGGKDQATAQPDSHHGLLDRVGRFHVMLPDVYVEESEGELVVTRLRRSVLPLLRYRTGDPGHVIEDRCPCGYRGQTIVGFSGRSVCLFERADGSKVDAWQLAVVLKYTRLRAFRLSQVGPEDFELEIGERVRDTTGDVADLVARLKRALEALGWNRPEIQLKPLDQGAGVAKPAPFRALWTNDRAQGGGERRSHVACEGQDQGSAVDQVSRAPGLPRID